MKAEITLTVTMLIISIPAVLNQLIMILVMYAKGFVGYAILVRPILMDFRVNTVSCYFYWTHPYYKKKTTNMHHSINAWSPSN
ncbi:hypothetical protein CRE_13128 [Caenorhabditis remanei]|uniref:Serpentine receptor class gamma n=1 Tax=Caenorhabditis remanei TaxID=31234 RepID=E3NJM1_CAERE|nr:hypothetical protein CRE_31610 [Caenorhabditis remanei]EFP00916.1 hypothetical protein CRE_13128 [Caenorhabditis remanei]